MRLEAKVDVSHDQYKVDPIQTPAIPEAYRERTVGAELAARATALERAQTQPTAPNAPETGRQNPVTALEAMRAASRATVDRQREEQRAAGLTVKASPTTRSDQPPPTDDPRTQDAGRER